MYLTFVLLQSLVQGVQIQSQGRWGRMEEFCPYLGSWIPSHSALFPCPSSGKNLTGSPCSGENAIEHQSRMEVRGHNPNTSDDLIETAWPGGPALSSAIVLSVLLGGPEKCKVLGHLPGQELRPWMTSLTEHSIVDKWLESTLPLQPSYPMLFMNNWGPEGPGVPTALPLADSLGLLPRLATESMSHELPSGCLSFPFQINWQTLF